MKWADVIRTVDLSDGETHKVTIDPSNELETRQGRAGDYWATIVSEHGRPSELNLGKRLRDSIAGLELTKPTEITIRRTGEGFQTDYEVSVA